MGSSLFCFISIVCLGICYATELNVTEDTTFAELSRVIVDLGFSNLQSLGVVANDSTPSDIERRSTGGCPAACSMLETILSPKVASPGSDAYEDGQIYWANQQVETLPTCRVNPTEAREISATLLILEFTKCPFAVKSGGHANFAGGSNIQDGVTIDLQGFKNVTLSTDKTLATIGAGNTGGRVIDILTPLGYTITTGRVYDVGVGGYTLGGGISWVTNRRGLAADNVASYDVVLASGRIVNASPVSFPDLYWALRGGGNNFGVVTNFHFYAYPIQPNFWAGFYGNAISQREQVFEAFEDFVLNKQDNDLDAQFILSISTDQTNAILTHAAGTANASAFESILAIPPIFSTLAVQTMDQFVRTMGTTDPYGYRQIFITHTIKIDSSLLKSCHDIFIEETTALTKAVPMLAPWMSVQSISKNTVNRMSVRGGNPLGLSDTGGDGTLLIMAMELQWYNATDDAAVVATAERIFSRSFDLAQSQNRSHPYIYQNYATKGQTVFRGYGEVNQRKLQVIAKKYDPIGYLQWLQPGYFKLDH